MKSFDLNVEKILEDWETYHAIREVIANALDEQALTNTKDIQIFEDRNQRWHIRDFGRGIRYEHLTQKENEEKLRSPHLIGKFGVGIKDALATFDRRGIKVWIKSCYGDITIGKSQKHDFEDITTLHAYVSPPSDSTFVGTEFILEGCTADDLAKAKNLFLKFSREIILETTPFGEVLEKKGDSAKVFINGVRVADEENFLFSYNITSMTAAIKKSLNRERSNVGRTAYSDRIKAILLACKGEDIAKALVDDLKEYKTGLLHDELKWTEVAVHASKLLNALERVVFATPDELSQAADLIDNARRDSFGIITLPDNVRDKITGETDFSGNEIRDLHQFKKEWTDSFEFRFVDRGHLSLDEVQVYDKTNDILKLVGGRPPNVKEIRISETMRMESFSFEEATGLWDNSNGYIIIKRTQLKNIEHYAGTLLHEIGHACSGATDITREFERALTRLLGILSSGALKNIGS